LRGANRFVNKKSDFLSSLHIPFSAMLLPLSHTVESASSALREAAERGHAGCVALLLPHGDPLAQGVGGYGAAGVARVKGFEEVAGMIEAFVEALELSRLAGGGAKSRTKAL
jgi:hypothetical protein